MLFLGRTPLGHTQSLELSFSPSRSQGTIPDTTHGTAIGLPITWGGLPGGLAGAAVRTGSPR